MNVLHPTTTFPQHADDHWGPFVLQLCEAIAGQGAEVEVLAANTPETRPFDSPCDIRRFDYFIGSRFQTLMTPPGLIPNMKNRPWRGVQLPFFYRALAKNVRSRAKEHDLVHAHWLIPTGFAAGRNVECPIISTVWGAEYHVKPTGILGRAVRQAQKNADYLVAVSDYLRQRGISRFDCPPEKISVIPNAVDTTLFHPEASSSIRDRYDIPPDDTLIVSVRRLVPEKRVSDFVAAVAAVCEEHDDVTALVVGDGPERPALEEQAAEAKASDRIIFTGALPHNQIPGIMAAADISVLTTEQEGMATALLEAMAGGAVPVATEGTGNDEVVEDGEQGILCPTGDIDMLSEKLSLLVSRPETRKRMATASRKRVVESFSYDAVATEYVSLYDRLI